MFILLSGLLLVGGLAICTVIELLSMWNLTRIEVQLCNMLSPEAYPLSLGTYNWCLVSNPSFSLVKNVIHIFQARSYLDDHCPKLKLDTRWSWKIFHFHPVLPNLWSWTFCELGAPTPDRCIRGPKMPTLATAYFNSYR